MGGSYERAGTIGFRCVADAEDDCGTNGELCASALCKNWYDCTPPAAVTLPTAANADWLHFGSSGLPATRKAAGAQPTLTFAPAPQSRVVGIAEVLNGTAFSWSGGSGPKPSGSNDRGGVVFGGDAGGFTLSAPAPSGGSSSTLTMYISHEKSAVGNITARVGGYATTLSTAGATAISVCYKGGPLSISAGNKAGTACSAAQDPGRFCLRPAQKLASKAVVSRLSDSASTSVLDWAHWGGVEGDSPPEASPWRADTMKGGLGVLVPSLSEDAKKNLSPFYNTMTYSWDGGTPLASTSALSSGVFSGTGTFKLSLPAPPANTTWGLTIYAGAFNCAAKLTITSADKAYSSVQRFPTPSGTQDYAFSVSFTSAIEISWAKDLATDPVDGPGNLTLQAAKLELLESAADGITLQSATLT